MKSIDFLVRKDDLSKTELREALCKPLSHGQIRLSIDRFAFTSNNISYAQAVNCQRVHWRGISSSIATHHLQPIHPMPNGCLAWRWTRRFRSLAEAALCNLLACWGFSSWSEFLWCRYDFAFKRIQQNCLCHCSSTSTSSWHWGGGAYICGQSEILPTPGVLPPSVDLWAVGGNARRHKMCVHRFRGKCKTSFGHPHAF